MGAWTYIMDLVGEPGRGWPNYCGHLKIADRMQLAVFLFANGASPELIKELGGCTHKPFTLVDASAEKHWASRPGMCQ